MEIPSPIPNLVVKHFIADNTAGSPGGNVGRCQLIEFLLNPPRAYLVLLFIILVGQGKLFYFTSCFLQAFLYLHSTLNIWVLHLFLVKVIFYIKLLNFRR